jgi:hypothetical protein
MTDGIVVKIRPDDSRKAKRDSERVKVVRHFLAEEESKVGPLGQRFSNRVGTARTARGMRQTMTMQRLITRVAPPNAGRTAVAAPLAIRAVPAKNGVLTPNMLAAGGFIFNNPRHA